MNIRGNKGVTLIALTLTVIIILMLTGAIIYNSRNHISMQKINQLNNDIEVLDAKIDDYYLRYGELPILCEYVNSDNGGRDKFVEIIETLANGNQLNSEVNSNDGNTYAVIDLEKLSGLTLNYGYDEGYRQVKANKSPLNGSIVESTIYVINTKTHQIYFPHGITADGIMYYTHI